MSVKRSICNTFIAILFAVFTVFAVCSSGAFQRCFAEEYVSASLSEETAEKSDELSKPSSSVPSGAYNGIESLTIELSGEGTIRYTIDSSLPTASSAVYNEPLVLSETTILRAVSVRENGEEGPVATFSYFINENHTLPILSLVNDSSSAFNAMYNSRHKGTELPSFLALYENGEERFAKACGVTIKGNASRNEAKVSLGVYFRSKYGDGKIRDCDIFGNGKTKYSSLSIRAGGQDWNDAVFRNELFQALCLEMGDSVPCQNGKFCILYVDGVYKGIYCLKENVNEHFYAAWAGVDSDTVTDFQGAVGLDDDVYNYIYFAIKNDMSHRENYDYFCEHFDIENLIDWAIIEGYSGNTDTQGNVRYFRSSEGDGKYRIALFDIDLGFTDIYCAFRNIFEGEGTAGVQIHAMIDSLLRNADFRDRFLTRYGELVQTVLSDEHVLAKIREFEALLEPEIDRSFRMYRMDRSDWEYSLHLLDRYVAGGIYADYTKSVIRSFLQLEPNAMEKYFGG